MTINSVELLQRLIHCKSVTPHEGGAITLLENLFNQHGFTCHRLKFSDEATPDVENLYARWGKEGPHICFAGHTDVVPVGDAAAWTFDPFGGEIIDGYICGRGTADMKGAIAAFAAAALNFISEKHPKGSISFLITGDEEGPSVNGTKKVLDWMKENGEKPDFCIVGEPTSKEKLGDMIKIGRRGTLTGKITVRGVQGHVAYPHLADNPIPKLMKLLTVLDDLVLDKGNAHFQPSNLEIVNIDVGNTVSNIIPSAAHATFNVRFNDHYTGASLQKKLEEVLDAKNIPYTLNVRRGGESFYTPPGAFSALVAQAVQDVTGIVPELSTSGGTSDARFIKDICPVIECGIVGLTAHQVDEKVIVDDVTDLTEIYGAVLGKFLK